MTTKQDTNLVLQEKTRHNVRLRRRSVNNPLVKERKNQAEKARVTPSCFHSTSNHVILLLLLAGASLFLSTKSSLRTRLQVDPQVQQQKTSSHVSHRFPRYGSEQFAKNCSWTLSEPREQETDCILLYRPQNAWNEGVSAWTARVASEFISATLAGCRILFDYGENVEIGNVLQPLSGSDPISKTTPMNWTVPYNFSCNGENHCTRSTSGLKTFAKYPNFPNGLRIPNFRWLHRDVQNQSKLRELQQALPGFQLETGMACAIGGLFDLAPTASQFQPDSFSRILPTLRDENALVMAIYVRTGQTDKVAKAEKGKKNVNINEGVSPRRTSMVQPAVDCALSLEAKYLSKGGEDNEISFTKIVWMVVTDLPPFKQWFIDSYHDQDANLRVPVENRKWNSTVIPREIVTTDARGIHSRLGRNTSTADFAEAMIDWYLIGESDLVITSSPSYTYGATAAFRTARPFYDGRTCNKFILAVDNGTAL